MAKDLFDKYIWLVDTIYRSQKITFEELNRKWLRSQLSGGIELPLRTFHNWRTAIEDIFDINIACNRKGGYYYYIENIDDIKRGGVRNWLLNTFTVNNLIHESRSLKRRILFEEIPSGRQYLSPLIEAMRDSVEVELLHKSFWYSAPKVYTVQPYCVKVFKQRWYVMGFCKERNDLRIFSLDRINDLKLLDTTFVYPKDFDPAEFFENSFGIINGDIEPRYIRLKVWGMQRFYLRALPFHHSQKEVEETDEYSVFEYYLKPTFDFKQEILSQGSVIEVVSPADFREEIKKEVLQMAAHYRG